MTNDEYIYTCTKCVEDLEPYDVDIYGNAVSYICTSCGTILNSDEYNLIMGKETKT